MELDVIYNMDCLLGMQELPSSSIDMICCDLPYGVTSRKRECALWDNVIPFEPLWEQYERIIKPDGAIVLFAAGMFTHQLAMSNPKLFRYNLVWKKGKRVVGFLDAKRKPLRAHEDILVFGKTTPKYFPQKWQSAPYKARQFSQTAIYAKTKAGYNTDCPDGMRYPTSVIDIGMPNEEYSGRLHPTQKPVELIEYLIKTYTQEGDVVLDSCMGSGTTAIAAIRTNRHYVGYELNDEFFEKIKIRIAQEPAYTTAAL